MMTESIPEDDIRDHDIQALLEAGVSMIALEDLYGPKAVHRVAETYISSHVPTEDNDIHQSNDDQRSKLATLLFLRAPSSSTKAILKKNQHNVVDAVFAALVADPEDPLLMDPLLHTVLHDPVVLSSGIILDRSTAMDPTGQQLRFTKCPFRRIPLHLPVYELYPLQEKIRAYEHERLARCVSVAQTFVHDQDYDRAERVFAIAHDFLQEHQRNFDQRQSNRASSMMADNSRTSMAAAARGNKAHGNNTHPQTKEDLGVVVVSTSGAHASQKQYTRDILLLALQLAQLEREMPRAKEDISRMVAIHRRLIQVARACSADPQDTETLVIACLEDCWKRCSLILAFAAEGSSTEASHRALLIRHVFSPLITYTQLFQMNLTEELQKLCQLDLRLAKDVEDEPAIWNCRRVLLKLLPEAEKATFLESEGIAANEEDLHFHLVYDTSAWRNEKFVDPSIGLVHFGMSNTPVKSSQKQITGTLPMTQTRGVSCWVDLNPLLEGDHWIEVAFCPDNIQSPGHLNPILSQYSSGAGWEIRCVVVPEPKFPFGIGGEKREPGIYVESVWVTTDGDNAVTNTKVPLEIRNWYHVFLAYCYETSTISLYVNGLPVRQKIKGVFVPAKGSPRLGESMQWMDRRLQGWAAFGGGGYGLPVNGKETSALDVHVQTLAKARLTSLPNSSALRKLYSVDGGDGARISEEDVLDSMTVRKDNSINENSSSREGDP